MASLVVARIEGGTAAYGLRRGGPCRFTLPDILRKTMSLRALLLAALVLSMLGTGSELLLLNHVEGWAQRIPVILLGVALLLLALQVVWPGGIAISLFQVTMALFVAAGVVGVVFHYQGASAFQLEVDPSLEGFDLFWTAVRAKAPPALAPGSLIALGIVGFAYTQCARRME
jgi:hypothetical protein